MLGGSYQAVFTAKHEAATHVHHLISKGALNRYRDYLRTQHIQPPTYLADDTQSWAPAIRMSAEDHKRTPSYCGKGKKNKSAFHYINSQTDMLKEGNLKGCFDLEVQNLKRIFGDKYNTHLSQAEAYLTKFLEDNPFPTFSPNVIEELSRIRIELNTLLDRVENLLKDAKDGGH